MTTFDGTCENDPIKAEAHDILSMAIGDEAALRGKVFCTETLCVFIEFRIEQALRARDGL